MLIRPIIVIALFGGLELTAPLHGLSSPSPRWLPPSSQAGPPLLSGSGRFRHSLVRLSFPEGWWPDPNSGDPPGLTLLNGEAVCGVHPVDRTLTQSLPSFASSVSAAHADALLNMGIRKQVTVRRTISLANGLMGIEQEVVLHQGGKSLELYVVHGDAGYVLICETEARCGPPT